MKSTVNESFEMLSLPKRDFPQLAMGNYRVYKNTSEFLLVAAGTALEAMQASGLTQVYKIERDHMDQHTVLSPNSWKAQVAVEEAAVVAPAVEVAQPVAAAPVEPAAEVPLSNDDVNKLLNG
jgi:hypothetical protein